MRGFPRQSGQSLTGAAGERDDSLALVTFEGFPVGCGGLVRPAGGFQDAGEVEVRVALHEQRIHLLGQADRLAGQPFPLRVLAAVSSGERPQLPKTQLGVGVGGSSELGAPVGQALGLVADPLGLGRAAEEEERPAEGVRTPFEEVVVVERLELLASSLPMACGNLVFARDHRRACKGHLTGIAADGEAPALLVRLLPGLGEAAEGCDQDGADAENVRRPRLGDLLINSSERFVCPPRAVEERRCEPIEEVTLVPPCEPGVLDGLLDRSEGLAPARARVAH